MKYIDEVDLSGKVVLLRVDFNVPLSPALTVTDDQRIRASLPTINYLLERRCRLILVSHLGRPEGVVNKLSLAPVAEKLHELLPTIPVKLVDNSQFLSKEAALRSGGTIFMLENVRFYAAEQENDPGFAKKLADLADVFVNDAFSVSHRADASVVGVTKFLPSYGGLLLKKELSSLQKLLQNPQKPFVAILGGSKISTKLGLIEQLGKLVDTIIVGGGIANTLLLAQGHEIGKSICEKNMLEQTKNLFQYCEKAKVKLLLPIDVVTGSTSSDLDQIQIRSITELSKTDNIFDIGPKTRELYTREIANAKTIVWNGPVGYFENPAYQPGTDAIFEAIIANMQAFSVAGGGDTLSYLGNKVDADKISFISTGGGAMLEYLAKGTLPGIDALK